jgi:threonylcarbamoyladenosine tRNA methylthiotransferase MtaB
MNVYLDLVGCRLNQAEIERYACQFRLAGHTLVADPEEADLAVINTCAVTSAAESDSRQKIRFMARSGIEQVVITGCWATLRAEEAAALPSMCCIVPNQQKDDLVSNLLSGRIATESPVKNPLPVQVNLNAGDVMACRQPIPGARLRTRAFIKAQDGCNNRCSFCNAVLARGLARSRELDEILQDIESARGVKEVVLTGLHLGSWGQDFSPPLRLWQLMEAVLSRTSLPRLRISSIEPWEMEPELIQLWENPRLCQHIHLPLQSGCASTLRRMRRRTLPESFSGLVESVRAIKPEIAITTDIITGFPGESEAEFQESLEFVRSMHFAGGHVFTYSARPGTAAACMPDQVPHSIRKERNAWMQAALKEGAQSYQETFLSRALTVLWESVSPIDENILELSGLTGNYLRVKARSSRDLWNQITPVHLDALQDGHIQGTIIEQ